jgi:hypothetical protein
MNKIKITEKPLKNAEFAFEGQNIEVVPFITSQTQESLILVYFTAFFEGSKENRVNAERINKMAVLDLLTNVDIDSPDGTTLVEMLDNITSSGLWEKIEKSIKNYREYEHNLSIAIDSKRKENSDIGFIFKQFIDEKINPLIEKFSSMDFTDEKLSEMKSLVAEVTSNLKDTPLGNIVSKGTV